MNKALYFFLIILTFGCAQFVPPTGGPTDKKAPELLVSEPANKTINFKGNSISLTFNEYVDISTLKQDLIIIPDPKSLYTAKLKDKTVRLVFDEKFADSTTYTFNFRNGIKDLNEKNPATNLKIVVSTGPKIDSLNIKGKVKDLHTKLPILEATVGLYKADTLPWNRKKPDYFIKTDSSGLFTFENIKNGKYFVLAFTDRNNNLIYDQKNESVAFISDSINLTKNIELDTMELFTANYSKNKIKKVISRETEFVIQLDKNYKEATVNIEGRNLEKYTTKNSIILFKPLNENLLDTIKTEIYLKDSINLLDTLKQKIYFTKPTKSTNKKKQAFSIFSSYKNGQELTKNVFLEMNFESPIVRFDTMKIKFKTDTVSFEKPKYTWLSKTKFTMEITTKAKNQIEFIIPSNTMENIKGDTNAIFVSKNIILQTDELGTLEGSAKEKKGTKIVQLINEDTGVIAMEQSFTEKFKFINIIPANYFVKVIIDENNNGIWDPGNLSTRKMPEKVMISKEAIRVRPNFEIKDILIE